jgi:UMF1 family MFS transporter
MRSAAEAAPASISRAPAREIFGWAMFDFANSSYTTVIVTVVFSVVYPRLVVADAPGFARGNLLWSLALSLSYGLVVATAAPLGAIMDYRAAKKRFLFASYTVTVLATASLWLVEPGNVWLGFFLVALSNYGFAVGESFCAAFLPELGPPESLGKISGFAWGLGYVGGIACAGLVLTVVGPLSAANFERVRLTGPITAAFFMLAAVPTFALLRERGTPRTLPPGETLLGLGFRRLAQTLRELRAFRDLMLFYVAVFFAMAGLSIIIAFTFIYGDQVVRWSARSQMLMFVLTNLTASVGAVGFGYLQARWGNLKTFNLTLGVWVLAVIAIWGTEPLAAWLNAVLGRDWSTETVFLGLGCVAGLCLGATQSASRTLVAIFSPDSKAGEFFGLWGLFGKLASIVGLVSLGALQARLGLRAAILLCSLFFFVAMVITAFVREARGRETALRHAGE